MIQIKDHILKDKRDIRNQIEFIFKLDLVIFKESFAILIKFGEVLTKTISDGRFRF